MTTKAAAPMTASAQTTARRWLEAELERAERLTRLVSGQGEHAEILATILAMLDERSLGQERPIMAKAAERQPELKVVDAPDKEIEALRTTWTALDGIQPDARRRVLGFLKSKFSDEWPSDIAY